LQCFRQELELAGMAADAMHRHHPTLLRPGRDPTT
jgi:hypothetical protein